MIKFAWETEAPADSLITKAKNSFKQLQQMHHQQAPWLGWMDMPTDDELNAVVSTAESLVKQSDVIVIIGVGGSYLGSRAGLDFMFGARYGLKATGNRPEIVYVGNSLSPSDMADVLDAIKDKDFSIVYISKSGGTFEPAVAFDIFYHELTNRYGDNAKQRIIAITDPISGKLRQLANEKKWTSLPIPANVGGRFSAFTAANLLPLALAGCDIKLYVKGAAQMLEQVKTEPSSVLNYVAFRHQAYQNNQFIECFAVFEPRLRFLTEWIKQLFGESEGKQHKGVFPASLLYTADLHSMGQYLQDGRRNLCETIIEVSNPLDNPATEKLNQLTQPTLQAMNQAAIDSVVRAHTAGGVAVSKITLTDFSARSLGQTYMFLMLSCAVSGLMFEVDPFDQPGVEQYKAEMRQILEQETKNANKS